MSLGSEMEIFFSLFLLLSLAIVGLGQNSSKFSRDDFPSSFIFGAGTSAYQVEGAVREDGRTISIWDVFTHKGMVEDKSTGDIASGGYHKYKEDVKLMSDMGLEAYRFSISWSRLLPNGRGAINPKGLEYYNNLLNELIKHGIQPHVTLYHLDLPLEFEEEYGGWLSPKIIEDFTAYADVCFREFGDRVTHWTTLNEPNVNAIAAYDTGVFPPERCSYPSGFNNCTAGNSSVEPYIVVHHSLLAHASAAALYREKYQAKQNGWIGLNVYALWFTSFTNSTADVMASQRVIDFYIGWLINPLVFGDYPETMKKIAGSRIPSFTKHESKLVKGSSDFIGLNHYLTVYIEDNQNNPITGPPDYSSDIAAKYRVDKDETPTTRFRLTSTPCNPSGLESLLRHLKDYYGNPPIYIHENGYKWQSYNETLNDTARVNYLSGYIEGTLNAIRNGSNTIGYFAWSFMDLFELTAGYQARFGLIHVDFEDKELKRQPKSSARWYSDFLKKKGMKMKNTDEAGSLFDKFHSSH